MSSLWMLHPALCIYESRPRRCLPEVNVVIALERYPVSAVPQLGLSVLLQPLEKIVLQVLMAFVF